jgi:hypothetical protein
VFDYFTIGQCGAYIIHADIPLEQTPDYMICPTECPLLAEPGNIQTGHLFTITYGAQGGKKPRALAGALEFRALPSDHQSGRGPKRRKTPWLFSYGIMAE